MMTDRWLAVVLVVGLLLGAFAGWVAGQRTRASEPDSGAGSVTHYFHSADHDTVTAYEVDFLDAAGAVVQTILVPKARTTVTADGEVAVVVDTPPRELGVYTSRVRAVRETSAAAASTVSPNGTRLPPAPQIVDTELDVWTLVDGQALEDGAPTGGTGTELRWCDAQIVIAEGDGDWWTWTGGSWTGPVREPCADVTPPPVTTTVTRSSNSTPSNPWERKPIAVVY